MKTITIPYPEIKSALYAAYYGQPGPLNKLVKERGGCIQALIRISDTERNMGLIEWVDLDLLPRYTSRGVELNLDPSEWSRDPLAGAAQAADRELACAG